MQVLHVIPYMHPSAGGPPVVVENLVRESCKLGHQSQIVSTTLFCESDEANLMQRLNELAPTVLLSASRASVSLNAGAWQRLGSCVRTADIVHLHTLWNPLNFMVRTLCGRYRRPYVLMPHGMLDPYSMSVRSWRKAFYLWAVERRNIARAQRLIYTTTEEARLATSAIVDLPTPVVVPLGGNCPAERPEKLASEFLARFPRAKERRQLVFLGRLHFKKGLDRILAALPSILQSAPDVVLTIAGSGSPKFEAGLKGEIRRMGLEDNVILTGRLEGRAKWGAYASAEMFLLPSRQENFAITVAEAMQMGIPVVVSDKVNTWPYVRDAGAGIVLGEEEIVAKLAKSIVSLLADHDTRQQMGRRGQDYARRHLTWTGATANMLKCYEEVIRIRVLQSRTSA